MIETAQAALTFPQFDPVAIAIGPLQVRWYALSYILGLLLAWRYCRWLTTRSPAAIAREAFDDFLFWAIIGVVIGGRLGYVLFYAPHYFAEHPLEALMVWKGGMAFHGGLLGVAAAAFLFCRNRRLPFFGIMDIVACAAPIGLFLGRIANFINGELWGRTSDLPWAMVFPAAGPEPRHPSQLYQAGLEGLLLFLVLFLAMRQGGLQRYGLLSGVFLIGYAVARSLGEVFRQFDTDVGLILGLTQGQLYSVPMLLLGIYLVATAQRAGPRAGSKDA
ncbi:MAG: prolipoprotein diacylglyceryl transferase [Tistlia sp.]|uniref:prolipoprotein diacylglyceryl transferase n=1 Tax=Tistlia sp. TaxID=3057121 RepID=UPI0034A39257